jgi:hypothetical protein
MNNNILSYLFFFATAGVVSSQPLPEAQFDRQYGPYSWQRLTEASFDPEDLRAYRGAGEEPEFYPANRPMPALTEAENERGFVVFRTSWMERTFPTTVPERAQITDTLSLFASLGEFEPATFLVRPQADLKSFKPIVAGDLAGPNGARIPTEQVRLGIVNGWTKYGNYYKPVRTAIAPILKPVDIPADYSEQFWVTIHVPNDAVPGMYRGAIDLLVGDAAVHALDLEVEVLPINLLEPDIAYGMFFDHQRMPPHWVTGDLMSRCYRDMAEHGMNSVTFYTTSGVITNNELVVDVNHNYRFSPGDSRFELGISDLMERAEAAGLIRREIPVIYLGYTDYRELERRWEKLNMPWPRATPTPTECSQIAAYTEKRGWPELLFYMMDELGGIAPFYGARTMMWQRETTRPMHAAGLRVANAQGYFLYTPEDYKKWYASDRELHQYEVVTNAVGDIVDELVLENIYHYLDVCLFSTAMGMDETVFNKMRALGKEYWAYDCIHPSLEPESDRFMFGVYAKRIRTRGFWQWHYGAIEVTHDEKQYWPWMDEQGVFHNMGDYWPTYVVLSPLGPIPTLSWEGKREGIDDYRYMLTLQRLIDMSVGSGDEASGMLAAEAQSVLDEFIAKIPVDAYRRRRNAVGAGYVRPFPEIATDEYDRFRRTIADWIVRLKGNR